MRALAVSRLLTRQDLDHFLEKTISWLRWATIAALLVISLAQPSAEGTDLPDWALLILFAGYNLLVELIRRRFSRLSAFAWLAVLDLPVIALIYLNCSQPGGPLFVLLILAAVQTTVFMTLTGNLLYTSALAAITIGHTIPFLPMSGVPDPVILTVEDNRHPASSPTTPEPKACTFLYNLSAQTQECVYKRFGEVKVTRTSGK